MTDIYALWILCEMASGLKLRSHAKSLREFRSKNKDIVLKYDAPEQVRQGWSDSIMGSLFGDAEASANPIQGSGRPEIFMNYRGVNFYFEAKYELQQTPRQEDVYKVLAYMNNYDVPCGGIIYPGPQLKITVDRKNGQVMAWIPFTWTEKAFEVSPNYFAFIADRMATIYSRIEEDNLETFVSEVERNAFEFYEAIATPGAVVPEMPEFLYNEEVELDLDEIIDMEEEAEEELLESIAEEGSNEKRKQLASDIESDSVASGEGSEGDYAISKNITDEGDDSIDIEKVSSDIEPIEEFSADVEEIDESELDSQEIPSDDPSEEKKISVSIERLRKMVDKKEN
jgi:hypothetical protein